MPFVRTSQIRLTKALTDALLAALSARPAAALFDTPTAHLFVNDVDVTAETVIGDFDEAAFDGYAADAVGALAGPITLADGQRAMHAEVDFIAATGIVGPGEVVYGVYVTDGAGTTLYAAERLSIPVPIANPGDFLSYDLVIPEPPVRTPA